VGFAIHEPGSFTGRLFVKRFALCYRTIVCPVLSVTLMYCGQTVGQIKMKLGMQVGLGLTTLLDADPAPLSKGGLQRGAEPPIFGPYLLWPNGSMDPAAIWYGGRTRPRRLCVRWGPTSRSPKRGLLANFWPMSIVAKRLDGSRWHFALRWALVQATPC